MEPEVGRTSSSVHLLGNFSGHVRKVLLRWFVPHSQLGIEAVKVANRLEEKSVELPIGKATREASPVGCMVSHYLLRLLSYEPSRSRDGNLGKAPGLEQVASLFFWKVRRIVKCHGDAVSLVQEAQVERRILLQLLGD